MIRGIISLVETWEQRNTLRLALLFVICCGIPLLAEAAEAERISFESEVAPLLAEHCVRCHSPGNMQGEVSLASPEHLLQNGYVEAGDASASYLMELVTSGANEPAAMPRESEPLTEAEVNVLRRWINEGAAWPDGIVVEQKSAADSTWWAYQPLNPQLRHAGAEHDQPQTIDEYLKVELQKKGLAFNPPADRRTLIRRASYDLIGLPPTPEEVQAFVNDSRPDAYERLIERLLASPHYGERWGRHWLDVVRFGESNGFERNVIINTLWPFRDYVIRSLNEDKPFDQFIREHLAGDVLANDDPETAVGSAFLVAGPYDDVGNQDPVQAAQIRANTLDEIIRATGEAFLGMTIGCARCHNHKFDPITQEDYYALYATFAGVRHGAVQLATSEERQQRSEALQPLEARRKEIEKQRSELNSAILQRGREMQAEYEQTWTREPPDRTGTEDRFEPVEAKFVRILCRAQDGNPNSTSGFRIDEFEVWSASSPNAAPEDSNVPRNVALASNGGKATGPSRQIQDFPGAYGPQLAIDGKTGARFIATGNHLTIELAEPTWVDRVVFSSARGETTPGQRKFTFVAEYAIEVSQDGKNWQEVASSRDRKPIPQSAFVNHRLAELTATDENRKKSAQLASELAAVNREIAAIPGLPSVWIGRRVANDAKGPFHVFLGGSPQKKGEPVTPASLSVFEASLVSSGEKPQMLAYQLPADISEAERRTSLAEWITHEANPLTPRVLANRLWHYHFGTGIVSTPSDFGYMGSPPSHPALLDFLAIKLQEFNWQIKSLHRMIMLSEAYQQSGEFREEAAAVDSESRLLWRFPPRRLSAEEVRDTLLKLAGHLETISPEQAEEHDITVPDGGPGFRLYHFMQDNVCTYVPLDRHGPETYRRAVYHQNARASVVDLMTEFDQPDCAFSTPKRAETTTPLQALTMLNHSFTLDMSRSLAERLQRESGDDVDSQIRRAFQLCYSRPPSQEELTGCRAHVAEYGLPSLCRVLLNTTELIYVH
ncbi:DUF1553 domain-containing protein [Rubinisphaera sp. JC750]|uniref:DUF1553 domain-containing protein n=1 Tax=Rubinisphaera sp. JC750 TaxID=2898658 RepID=UPI001F45D5A6|nr:DUF1553 domain-containing protein [Rubinisphaera sp. JC750]